ncbi:SRPBCC family protein [Leifsonia sp. NPDC056824]|uniref:SRPBCC family protein n=1 Tax=Leifsonia sp. NPDC056824 TaxID=3345953 RepID=UPI00369D74DC
MREPEAVESSTADREIVVTRVIDAPPELVFEAFTSVTHLSRWWGPEGFSTTTRSFDFRVGGEWVFTMRGPDGAVHPEWITWTAIVPPERIEMLHGERRDDPDTFESALTFTPEGAATRIELRTAFPTTELRDQALERSHAAEGGRQTLAKLAGYVETTMKEEKED